jgi:hypothetical protein
MPGLSPPRQWAVTTCTSDVLSIDAHRVEVGPSGAVVFWTDPLDGRPILTLALAPGTWRQIEAEGEVEGQPPRVQKERRLPTP